MRKREREWKWGESASAWTVPVRRGATPPPAFFEALSHVLLRPSEIARKAGVHVRKVRRYLGYEPDARPATALAIVKIECAMRSMIEQRIGEIRQHRAFRSYQEQDHWELMLRERDAERLKSIRRP